MTDTAEWVPTADLVPWDKNPRNNDHAVKHVAKSIERFGWGSPILVRRADRVVIAGHTRLKAAQSLGLDKVLVRWMDLDPAQSAALALADNKLGEIAEWSDGLADVLRELEAEGVDLVGLGWDSENLSDLLSGTIDAATGDETSGDDEAPELQAEAHSRAGELYELGQHRLLCGDCRNAEDVARLLDGQRINLAFTSPPYASQRTYDESSGFKPIPPDEYVEWFEAVQANVREHLAEDGSWFVNITEASDAGSKQSYVKRMVLKHIDVWVWMWIEEFCWPRPALPLNPNMSRRFKNGWESVYHFAMAAGFKFRPDEVRHESDRVFSYADQKAAGKMVEGNGQGMGGGIMGPVNTGGGLAFPSNVLDRCNGGARVVGHSAAFPVSLPSFFVRAYTDEGDRVFDPFMGSGTTLIAAAKHGRIAYGTEISPAYCDLIRRRWTIWARENGHDPGPGALE